MRNTGRPKALTPQQEDQMYAEYLASGRAGAAYRKSFEDLAQDWQCSKTTVCHAMKCAKKRAKENPFRDPAHFVLKPADLLGQIERGFMRLERLKREVIFIEENLRNLFHQVPKHSRVTKLTFSKSSNTDDDRQPRKVRIHFLSWSTREFELSPLYGIEANHHNTPDEERYERHRYVIRDLLEQELARTEHDSADESLVRLGKEVDRKKLLSWSPVVMRLASLVNSWEDLERGVVSEKDLEALSEYLTGLEKKNAAKVPGNVS
jgi:hypothetical protein